ncbi:hypothetical protein N657DRAFT_74990 [Parathielavia appendiculata]|uniref:Uncharacterized protein n=1 Tax=Parathielavia appendiculata TaxID=2587402 RepID=A0AAN6UBG0_9PEZI|nr:hypothetical protein N657DRAFT_74990 [Parathielavia appendiculata]
MPAHCNFNREAIQINRNMKRAVSSLRAWCQRECPRVIELHHGSSGTCRSRPPPACTLAWHPGLLPSAESGLFWGPGWTWRPAQRRSSLNTPTPSHLRLLGLHCPRRITKSPTRDAEPVVVSVWPGFRWHPVVRWLAVRVGYLEGGEVGICGVFAWLASGWLIRSVTPSGERQSC